MKYRFEYSQDSFQFHDALLNSFRFEGTALIMDIKMLNASKDIIPDAENDMEILMAQATLGSFKVISFTDDEGGVHSGIDAIELMNERLFEGFNFFSMEKKADSSYEFDATGVYPYFAVKFECDSFILEWDEFAETAWYER